MTEHILACTGLRKSYGERLAVDGVGFTIGPGETYGLLGPNGAGKTTTVSMICGLLDPDAGQVTVCGHRLNGSAAAAKAAIGYVPQDIALYPDLRARENLEFFGRLYGLRGKTLSSRVDEILDLVGLRDRAAERVETFSGGMKRRLNIAAGLLHGPRLLVLDEPTVGVDPQSRNAILEGVEALRSDGIAVLYTTHYMEEAERLCDRIGIIDAGGIVAEGTRRELVEQMGGTDRIEIAATGPLEKFAAAARRYRDVEDASVVDGGVHLLARGGRHLLPKLFDTAERTGVAVSSLEVVEPDLEAVFLHITGKALRD